MNLLPISETIYMVLISEVQFFFSKKRSVFGVTRFYGTTFVVKFISITYLLVKDHLSQGAARDSPPQS